MSLPSKREYLSKIHGRYQRAGKEHKSRILDEFCLICGYHRKAALRLLNRQLLGPSRRRPGPEPTYKPELLLPPLKAIWLASDQLCSKLLKAALPEWLGLYDQRHGSLGAPVRQLLLDISPAQIDRLLRPLRVRHPRRGLRATKPGTLLRQRIPPVAGHRTPPRRVILRRTQLLTAVTRSPATSFIPLHLLIFIVAGRNCAPSGTRAVRPFVTTSRRSRPKCLLL